MKCLIVDGDPLVCETAESFLSRTTAVETCLKVHDGPAALNLIAAGGIDAVFLDLHIPDLGGEALLRALPRAIAVVVMSTSGDFGARSYDYDVVDYLLKPLEISRFMRAVEKLRLRMPRHEDRAGTTAPDEIFVKDGTRLERIDLGKLLFIKAEANYSNFIFPDRSVLSLMSLKKLEESLSTRFQRVHRSYIVNREHISSVEGDRLGVGPHKVPIGESYRDAVRRNLKTLG
jgi:two-component system, LytTR family, response regulator